ncbi:hypothetical protein CC2G_012056 [Coprinopsis cinerea AmutBmut pab1-1]|nr:hypothetical protein CC2G_012056 [Coprinopsis cinerea AmutBmut pab1-1]
MEEALRGKPWGWVDVYRSFPFSIFAILMSPRPFGLGMAGAPKAFRLTNHGKESRAAIHSIHPHWVNFVIANHTFDGYEIAMVSRSPARSSRGF